MIGVCLFAFNIGAQDLEILKVQYSYLPNGQIADSTIADEKIDFSEYTISVLLPAIMGDKFHLLAGGTFNLAFPQSANNEANTKLYFMGLRFIGAYDLNEKNRLIATWVPSISSTLEDDLSGDDFLTQASISYSRLATDSLRYGFGVMYTSRFGFPQALPLLTCSYLRAKVRYDIRLPISIRATWDYDAKFSYGLKLSVNGSQFNASQGAIYEGVPIDAVNFSRILLGPEFGIRLKEKLYLTLFAGVSLRRIFELKSENDLDQNLSLDNGLFFSAKISLKPNQN